MTASGYEHLQEELKKLVNKIDLISLLQLQKQEVMGIYLKMQNINMLKNSKV